MTEKPTAPTAPASPDPSRLARLQQLLVSDPTNVRLRAQCIELAVACGDFAAVLAIADAALTARPGDPHARFDRATGLIGLQQHRAALDVLLPLANTHDSEGIRFNLALCHYRLGEYRGAVPYLLQSYESGSREPRVLHLLLTSYHHLGMMEEAVGICAENAEVAKHDSALAGAYALIYLDADDAGRAAFWSSTALALNPRSVDARLVDGTLLTARLEKARARAVFQSIVADAPQTARAWLGLASLDLLQRELDGAYTNIDRALELMPQHLGSWHMLAWIQLLRKDVDGAEKTFDRALEIDRNFAETYGGLAFIAALRGDEARASSHIKVALRLDPNSLSTRFAQSVLAHRGGNEQLAQAMVDEVASFLTANSNSALTKLLKRSRK